MTEKTPAAPPCADPTADTPAPGESLPDLSQPMTAKAARAYVQAFALRLVGDAMGAMGKVVRGEADGAATIQLAAARDILDRAAPMPSKRTAATRPAGRAKGKSSGPRPLNVHIRRYSPTQDE